MARTTSSANSSRSGYPFGSPPRLQPSDFECTVCGFVGLVDQYEILNAPGLQLNRYLAGKRGCRHDRSRITEQAGRAATSFRLAGRLFDTAMKNPVRWPLRTGFPQERSTPKHLLSGGVRGRQPARSCP